MNITTAHRCLMQQVWKHMPQVLSQNCQRKRTYYARHIACLCHEIKVKSWSLCSKPLKICQWKKTNCSRDIKYICCNFEEDLWHYVTIWRILTKLGKFLCLRHKPSYICSAIEVKLWSLSSYFAWVGKIDKKR